jgi:transcriptional regulator with XRE-family HTH domain
MAPYVNGSTHEMKENPRDSSPRLKPGVSSPVSMTMKLPEKLDLLIAKRNWSQRDLSRALGDTSFGTVNRWFLGKSIPDLDEAFRISRLFGVSVDYLADDGRDDSGDRPGPKSSLSGPLSVEEEVILAAFRARNRTEGITALAVVGAIMGLSRATEDKG